MTLRQDVFRALRSDGFKGKNGVCKRPDADGFSFVVSTGPLNKRTDISPTVGIRHDEIENLWYDLSGLPRNEYSATIGANLGYVLDGTYRDWQPPATAEEVLGFIRQGFDKLRPLMHLDRIRDGFAIPGSDMAKNYTLVLVELVRGDAAGVERELTNAYDAYCGQSGEVCDQFLKFEANLRERGLPPDTRGPF